MGYITRMLLRWGVSSSVVGWIPTALYVVAIAAIFAAGWTVRDWKCDAAFYKAENMRLNARIEFLLEQDRKMKEAAAADQKQGEEDAAKIAELETKMKELEDALPTTSGACLDAGVVDRLRRLWE